MCSACRYEQRQASADIPAYKNQSKEAAHLVVDSSGIKIYGEGEWKMRLYAKEKRRTLRKLHVAVNEKTHDIVMSVVTHSNVHDTEVFALLLPNQDACCVSQVTGDGAYDAQQCYDATVGIGAKSCFPPRSAVARDKPTTEGKRLRNHVVGRVNE